MPESMPKDQLHKALFSSLIMMLSSSAMQQLGKLVNPMTGKTELDLHGAQMTIDMLEMLKAKSTGNLDEEEQHLLDDTLSSLQMNYVEVSQSAPAEDTGDSAGSGQDADDSAADEGAAGAEEAEEPSVKAAGDGDEPPPKFHKSYG